MGRLIKTRELKGLIRFSRTHKAQNPSCRGGVLKRLMRSVWATIVFALLLPGCWKGEADVAYAAKGDRSQAAPSEGIYHPGACFIKGNDPAKPVCATTFYQLLAHPELYDGATVEVLGWAMPGETGVVLYPSRESLRSGQLNAGIVIRDDASEGEIQRFLSAGSLPEEEVHFSITGKFTLGDATDRPKGSPMFGFISDVEQFGP